MKNCVIFLLAILSLSSFAQDYCLYNAQKSFHFGSGSSIDNSVEILQQTDEKYVLVGYSSGTTTRAVAARVYPNGNLDPGYADVGKFTSPFTNAHTAICADIQPDDRIIIAGGFTEVIAQRPYVMRLNNDGTLDESFGVDGLAIVPFGFTNRSAEANAIHVLPSGNIMVVSFMRSTISASTSAIIVSRLLPDGTLDVSYNGTGFSIVTLPADLSTNNPSSTILDDGTCFLVDLDITGGLHIEVTKVDPNGTVSTLFGNNGTAEFPEFSIDFSNDPLRSTLAMDGNLLVSAMNENEIPYVIKIDSDDGSLVTSFGTSGVVTGPIEAIGNKFYDIIVDEINQKYILIGGDFTYNVGTMTMDDSGTLLADCGETFNLTPIGQLGGQEFTAGLIDVNGVVRLTGNTGVIDQTVVQVGPQSRNFMWAYYFPLAPNPALSHMDPWALVQGEVVEVKIFGTGLIGAQGVALVSSTDTLSAVTFSVDNFEEISAVFFPQTTAFGSMDLHVYMPNDTLVLPQEAFIVDEAVSSGLINMMTRKKILVGAESLYVGSYKNTGNIPIVGAPLIIINTSPHSFTVSADEVMDLQGYAGFLELINYMNSQGISVDSLFTAEFEYGNRTGAAYYTPALAPGQCRTFAGFQTIPITGFAAQNLFFNPNGFLSPESLLDDYEPTPGNCMKDIVEAAINNAGINLNMDNFDDCFAPAFAESMDLVREVFDLGDDDRLIPMKPVLSDMLYTISICTEGGSPDLDYDDFQAFLKELTELLENTDVFGEDTPCPDGDECEDCEEENDIEGVTSLDPNEKVGPSQSFGGPFINQIEMPYTIHFENVDSAAIAAKTVLIVDTLDLEKIDINTFDFGLVSWGSDVRMVSPNPDVVEYDLRPETPNILRVTTDLDVTTGVATWLFETIDTLSLYPTTNIDHGFLPPNVTAPEGMGFVSFQVQLKSDITSGDTIANDALIYFDFNDPIVTNNWINIFDDEAPETSVLDITDYVNGETTATIHWQSDNDDSNILYYDIFYKSNMADDWILWQEQTTENTAVFEGELEETYYFMSMAVDSALNVENEPEMYDALLYMNPVGVEEEITERFIQVFPNPTFDYFTISGRTKDISYVKICDIGNRELYHVDLLPNTAEQPINISEFSAGIYIIKCYSKDKIVIAQEKLVKQ